MRRLTASAAVLLLALLVPAAEPQPAVRVIDMIPAQLSGETEQDSEPFLAVHPATPDVMAASAFTSDPGGAPHTAPIFVTRNGGLTWVLNSIVPSDGATADISHAFNDTGAKWFAGILAIPMPTNDTLLKTMMAADITSPALAVEQTTRNQVDQPWVAVSRAALYVSSNDFAGPEGRTATVDVSTDGGASFTTHRIEARETSGQDAPSVRVSAAKDGRVYAAFLAWRSFSGSVSRADVVVVRDDRGATSPNGFCDLTDPSDGKAGRLVVTRVSIPWINDAALGNQRIGSTLSIAVDPHNSDAVYVAWGDRVGNGDVYTIHVRRSTDAGATWSGDVRTFKNAVNVALAVADNGTAGLLYQQLTGTGAARQWVTRLEQSHDGFGTHESVELTRTSAAAPAPRFQPYLGDYIMLVPSGNQFRAVYSASNHPERANFPNGVVFQRKVDFGGKRLLDGSGGAVRVSIDPFYASVPVSQVISRRTP